MDKNTLTGLLLMGLVIFGFMYLNQPSAEELERQRQERERMEAAEAAKASDPSLLTLDSITSSEVAQIAATIRELGQTDTTAHVSRLKVDGIDLSVGADGIVTGTIETDGQAVAAAPLLANETSGMSERLAAKAMSNLRGALATAARYRGFARHLAGDSATVKLENKYLSLELSNKGGVISRATLRDYDSYDSTKVTLLAPETDSYGFTLTSANQRFDTREFFFTDRKSVV